MTPPKRRVTGQQGTQAQPLPARTTERYTPPLPIIQPRATVVVEACLACRDLGHHRLCRRMDRGQGRGHRHPLRSHHVLSQFVGVGLVFVGVRLGSARHHKH